MSAVFSAPISFPLLLNSYYTRRARTNNGHETCPASFASSEDFFKLGESHYSHIQKLTGGI